MPTYEYACSKCGHEFEMMQSMSDKSIAVCPKDLCPRKQWGRGKVVRKIGTGAGLIFKGTGFYITDYRSDKYKEAAKKDSAAASSSSAKDAKAASAASDSKPAAKPESKPAKTPAKS